MMDLKSLLFEAQINNEVAYDEVKKYLLKLVEPLINKFENISLSVFINKQFIETYVLNLIDTFIYEKFDKSIENIDNYFCRYVKFSLSNYIREQKLFIHRAYIKNPENERFCYYKEMFSLDDVYNDYQTLGDVIADEEELDMSTMYDLMKFEEDYYSDDKSGVSQDQKEIILMRFEGESFRDISKNKNIPYHKVLRDYSVGFENLKRYNSQNLTA